MDQILNIAPFNIAVETDVPLVTQNLKTMYPQDAFLNSNEVVLADYRVGQNYSSFLRRFVKPQSSFKFDQEEPFLGQRENHSYASFEWGLNYVIASHALEYVIIHSGIVALHDEAVLFPAPPGSGKSTLTAYLQGQQNWRLLSDEMALIEPHTCNAVPFVRPICLKNRSIDVTKGFYPDGVFSTSALNTHKGDVVHFRPSPYSWTKRYDKANISAIVFPQFQAGAKLEITQLSQNQGFMQFAQNAFNFSLLGKIGFDTLVNIVESARIFEVVYSDVNEVKEFLEQDVLCDR